MTAAEGWHAWDCHWWMYVYFINLPKTLQEEEGGRKTQRKAEHVCTQWPLFFRDRTLICTSNFINDFCFGSELMTQPKLRRWLNSFVCDWDLLESCSHEDFLMWKWVVPVSPVHLAKLQIWRGPTLWTGTPSKLKDYCSAHTGSFPGWSK